MEPLYWLILLAIFLVIEIITLGLTTIWLAGGALVGFLAAVLHVPLPIQIVLAFRCFPLIVVCGYQVLFS